MSSQQPSVSANPAEHPVTVKNAFIFKLPNELLSKIVECIGPPDISSCEVNWLVLPAVCRRLCEVAEGLRTWEHGQIYYPESDSIVEYGLRMPSKLDSERDGLSREFYADDARLHVSWTFFPVYRGGNVEYKRGGVICKWLWDMYLRERQTVDQYFRAAAHPEQSPSLNLSWITRLGISLIGQHEPDPEFSFSSVPCIVAPALEVLVLTNYVLDWCCTNLRILGIRMTHPPQDENAISNYRIPSSHLLARLRDSRLTLERVALVRCISITNTCNEESTDFPCLRDFRMLAAPREAWWLCQRMTFPENYPPVFYARAASDLRFIRSLACEYAHSVSHPKPALPTFHGELDALTIRKAKVNRPNGSVGCTVTASKITTLVPSPHPGFCHDFYAYEAIPRYVNSNYVDDVMDLDCGWTGLRPVFVTHLGWTLNGWESTLPLSDSILGVQCSALHGVRHLFIDGHESQLLRDATDAQIWTAILRHLPGVRFLYIHAPSPAALQPLINEHGLLPELRRLWLGFRNGSKGDVDAQSLLDIVDLREQLRGGARRTLELRLVNVNIVGNAEDIQELYRTRDFTLSDDVYLDDQT
ncbi:hypothetical protein PENSPDRAFT_647318 [Peniophora sp. CONT]|nr:hypothetical protein PENSPDRAFT_647318 [Peniophora sp. CONT]